MSIGTSSQCQRELDFPTFSLALMLLIFKMVTRLCHMVNLPVR